MILELTAIRIYQIAKSGNSGRSAKKGRTQETENLTTQMWCLKEMCNFTESALQTTKSSSPWFRSISSSYGASRQADRIPGGRSRCSRPILSASAGEILKGWHWAGSSSSRVLWEFAAEPDCTPCAPSKTTASSERFWKPSYVIPKEVPTGVLPWAHKMLPDYAIQSF